MKIRKHLTQVISIMDGDIVDFDVRVSHNPSDPDIIPRQRTGLDLTGITFVSKLLMISAYICSRNKQETDRLMFDPTFHAGKKRKVTSKKVRPEALDVKVPYCFGKSAPYLGAHRVYFTLISLWPVSCVLTVH